MGGTPGNRACSAPAAQPRRSLCLVTRGMTRAPWPVSGLPTTRKPSGRVSSWPLCPLCSSDTAWAASWRSSSRMTLHSGALVLVSRSAPAPIWPQRPKLVPGFARRPFPLSRWEASYLLLNAVPAQSRYGRRLAYHEFPVHGHWMLEEPGRRDRADEVCVWKVLEHALEMRVPPEDRLRCEGHPLTHPGAEAA